MKSIMKLPSFVQFSAIISTPFGKLGIRMDDTSLRQLVYLPQDYEEVTAVDELSQAVVKQIDQYLLMPTFKFDLPLFKVGTPFQRRVWALIGTIPAGRVSTYGELSRALHSSPRAVGQACGANWFPLVIPCHRVTAARGLGGFSNHRDEKGFHVGVKRWLLAHEGISGY